MAEPGAQDEEHAQDEGRQQPQDAPHRGSRQAPARLQADAPTLGHGQNACPMEMWSCSRDRENAGLAP